jgi:hypothetical protein
LEEKFLTRVAYGTGFSEWCANCHPGFLSGGGAGAKIHPAGGTVKLSHNVIANYNAYVASGNLTGSISTSFTSMVPIEAGTSDYELLKRMAKSDLYTMDSSLGSMTRPSRQESPKGARAPKPGRRFSIDRQRPTPPINAPYATSGTRSIDSRTWGNSPPLSGDLPDIQIPGRISILNYSYNILIKKRIPV